MPRPPRGNRTPSADLKLEIADNVHETMEFNSLNDSQFSFNSSPTRSAPSTPQICRCAHPRRKLVSSPYLGRGGKSSDDDDADFGEKPSAPSAGGDRVCLFHPVTRRMLTGNRAPRKADTIAKFLAEGWLPLESPNKRRRNIAAQQATSPGTPGSGHSWGSVRSSECENCKGIIVPTPHRSPYASPGTSAPWGASVPSPNGNGVGGITSSSAPLSTSSSIKRTGSNNSNKDDGHAETFALLTTPPVAASGAHVRSLQWVGAAQMALDGSMHYLSFELDHSLTLRVNDFVRVEIRASQFSQDVRNANPQSRFSNTSGGFEIKQQLLAKLCDLFENPTNGSCCAEVEWYASTQVQKYNAVSSPTTKSRQQAALVPIIGAPHSVIDARWICDRYSADEILHGSGMSKDKDSSAATATAAAAASNDKYDRTYRPNNNSGLVASSKMNGGIPRHNGSGNGSGFSVSSSSSGMTAATGGRQGSNGSGCNRSLLPPPVPCKSRSNNNNGGSGMSLSVGGNNNMNFGMDVDAFDCPMSSRSTVRGAGFMMGGSPSPVGFDSPSMCDFTSHQQHFASFGASSFAASAGAAAGALAAASMTSNSPPPPTAPAAPAIFSVNHMNASLHQQHLSNLFGGNFGADMAGSPPPSFTMHSTTTICPDFPFPSQSQQQQQQQQHDQGEDGSTADSTSSNAPTISNNEAALHKLFSMGSGTAQDEQLMALAAREMSRSLSSECTPSFGWGAPSPRSNVWGTPVSPMTNGGFTPKVPSVRRVVSKNADGTEETLCFVEDELDDSEFDLKMYLST